MTMSDRLANETCWPYQCHINTRQEKSFSFPVYSRMLHGTVKMYTCIRRMRLTELPSIVYSINHLVQIISDIGALFQGL